MDFNLFNTLSEMNGRINCESIFAHGHDDEHHDCDEMVMLKQQSFSNMFATQLTPPQNAPGMRHHTNFGGPLMLAFMALYK